MLLMVSCVVSALAVYFFGYFSGVREERHRWMNEDRAEWFERNRR